jgi:hypothetical protein
MANITVTTSGGATTLVSIGSRGPAGPAGGGGGGSTPAGSTGSVQINNSGALAADSGLVYTGTGNTGVLKIGGGSVIMSDLVTVENLVIGGGNPTLPLAARTTGTSNTVIGSKSMIALTTGAGNFAIGSRSLAKLTTGNRNIAIGTATLPELTTGTSNIGIGEQALLAVTTAEGNVAIGSGAGSVITTGWNNISIAGSPPAADSDNSICIGTNGDGTNTTVIGKSVTTQTRLVGNTLILGHASTTTSRTSLVQSASASAKTITLPNATGTVPVYTNAAANGKVLTSSGTDGAATWADPTATGVTSITAGTGLSGGTITTTGTISLSTTLPSAYAFTSTTRPTSSGTNAPVYGASPSLIHSNDFLTEQMFTRAQVRALPIYSLTSNGGLASAANDAITLQNTAIASGYAQGTMSRAITHSPGNTGSNTLVTIPIMFSFCGVIDVGTAGTSAVRFLCGANGLPMYDSNAFTARGVGWEVYYSTANARVEIRIISHDGTSYNTSTGVAFAVTFDKFTHIILEILGTGTVNLYGSASLYPPHSACPRPSNTPLITITNGPSGSVNRYGAAQSTIGTVTNAAGSYGVAMFKIQDAMIKVG